MPNQDQPRVRQATSSTSAGTSSPADLALGVRSSSGNSSASTSGSSAGGGAAGRFDFSFAFCNPQFSDCTLRVCADAETPNQKDAVLQEVPVSTLVLVAKSEYFKRMFMGSFQESGSKAQVDIFIPADYKNAFVDLLEFLYTGAIPPSTSSSFAAMLRLLVMADRFDVRDCVAEGAACLASLLPCMQPAEAVMVLQLPPSLLGAPAFSLIAHLASKALVKAYGPMMQQAPTDKAFLDIPETALIALLDADDLGVDSEDAVAEAAMAWALHNYPSPREQAEALGRVIMPRIRFQSLSPAWMRSLCTSAAAPWLHHVERPLQASPPSAAAPLAGPRRRSLSGSTPDRSRSEGGPLKDATETASRTSSTPSLKDHTERVSRTISAPSLKDATDTASRTSSAPELGAASSGADARSTEQAQLERQVQLELQALGTAAESPAEEPAVGEADGPVQQEGGGD